MQEASDRSWNRRRQSRRHSARFCHHGTAVALLLTFGSTNIWSGDFHPGSPAPYPRKIRPLNSPSLPFHDQSTMGQARQHLHDSLAKTCPVRRPERRVPDAQFVVAAFFHRSSANGWLVPRNVDGVQRGPATRTLRCSHPLPFLNPLPRSSPASAGLHSNVRSSLCVLGDASGEQRPK